MSRLIGILVLLSAVGLAACSSGVSNTGAGAANTDCITGPLDLACTATVSAPRSIDACIDVPAEGEEEQQVTAPATDIATVSVTVNDPLGEFSNTFQGVTFETFDVSFNSGQGGAPNLGTRRFTQTLVVQLSNSTGSGSVQIPLVDQVTKQQFRDQASCSTVYPYVVTVRATGRDFATNTPVVVVARTTIEIGNFVEQSGGDGDGSGDDEETGGS